ncbi:hypothetical protein LTR84_004183 [Exophiala bonariae]|uniref:Uncharacterized protein n=1 Tax=Exophiala bonariae TaxID=1690606 RepID=A0AAV9N5X3_9EURO|nr:hypothetical protein LTR84_004183 [Exophiala bonariae]
MGSCSSSLPSPPVLTKKQQHTSTIEPGAANGRKRKSSAIGEESVSVARREQEVIHQVKRVKLAPRRHQLPTPPPTPSPPSPAWYAPLTRLLSELASRQESLVETEVCLRELFNKCQQRTDKLASLQSYHGAHLKSNTTLRKEAKRLNREIRWCQHEIKKGMKWRVQVIASIDRAERRVRIEENRDLVEQLDAECRVLWRSIMTERRNWLNELD